MVFIDEKITREEYTLDWSQSKVFLVVLVLGFGSWSLTLI